MVKKRDRLTVIYDLLSVIKKHNNSIKRTPLLRYTNISSQSFNDYYKELLVKGFIRELIDKKGRITVTLTDKGFNFISKYLQVKSLIREFDL